MTLVSDRLHGMSPVALTGDQSPQRSLTLSVKEAIKNIWYYGNRRNGLEVKGPLVELAHTRALWHLCDIYMNKEICVKMSSQMNNCRLEREQFWTKVIQFDSKTNAIRISESYFVNTSSDKAGIPLQLLTAVTLANKARSALTRWLTESRPKSRRSWPETFHPSA